MNRVWLELGYGFFAGILALPVAVVSVCKISKYGSDTFMYVVFWLGSLNWIYDYQTLFTGTGAVIAAYFSIREIRKQVAASESTALMQIQSAEKLEAERREARKSANLAVSPLVLSSICQYAEINARILEDLLGKTIDNILPKEVEFPDFAPIPSGVAEALKELVEVLCTDQRQGFQRLLFALQVESSNLSGLRGDLARGMTVMASNLEARILGQASIYAEASSLFDFGRSSGLQIPSPITKIDVSKALFLLGLHEIRDDLIERYGLTEAKAWTPYSFFRNSDSSPPMQKAP